jgi:phospho-N-acetylmuramoyl-pentapeptide-transferase
MSSHNLLPLILGLIIFSFLISSVIVVPFINFLYALKLTRRKEAPKEGKVPLFDKLHDIKAGTPIGGGILIILIVTSLFFILFPLASYLGIFIQTSYNLRSELIILFFTFLSFGLLGLLDDLIKIFGKPVKGALGLAFGLTRRQKFILQWIICGFIV